MVRHLLVVVALMVTPSLAFARQDVWTFKSSEDPITDQKTSMAVVDGDSISIGLKCWGGEPLATSFMVMLHSRYDDAAKYKDAIEVIVRVDKGDPVLLKLEPVNLSGRLGLSSIREKEPKIQSVILALTSAKTRLAVAFGDNVFTVSAKGAPKAIDSFIDGCASSR